MTPKYIASAPYTDRRAAWEESLAATKKHIQYGGFLQAKGAKLIEGLNELKTIDDVEKWMKLYQQALVNIERGMHVEQSARNTLRDLLQQQPREA